MNPKVTVLIPVFNREHFVDEAVRSVIEQDFADFELLLVDDGSTDRTPTVLEMWKKRDPRVVVVTAPTNLGIPGALNLGLAHARGQYIARLDSDDLMTPRRLAEQVAVLDARPDVVLVSCAYDIFDLDGNHLRTWKGEEHHEVTAFLLSFLNVIGGGGQVMFRLAEVLEEGGYSLEVPSSEDYDLWVRLLRRGRIETLPFVGMTKRTHGNQSWKQFAEVKHANWTAITRSSLEPFLGRALRDEEVDALITVWHHDRKLGAAGIADSVMREAFVRFRDEVPTRAFQVRIRRRIAWQWYVAGRFLLSHRHPLETLQYFARAARWLISPRTAATDGRTRVPRPAASR